MKLEFLMEYNATLRQPAEMVGEGPSGNRIIVTVTGGAFEGPKLRGKVLPTGADWVRVIDGVTHLDVRASLETDDGAFIYVQYFGILRDDPGAAARADGEPAEYGDRYFMTSPRLETGDERYKWLNDLVTVAEGKQTPDGGVAYRVYAVKND